MHAGTIEDIKEALLHVRKAEALLDSAQNAEPSSRDARSIRDILDDVRTLATDLQGLYPPTATSIK